MLSLLRFMGVIMVMLAPLVAAPIYLSRASGVIDVYDSSTGAAVKLGLINGLKTGVDAIALSGNTLFVASGNRVGEYDATTGGAINANFITALNPSGFALFGNVMFVANANGTIVEYNATTGVPIDANFITGLQSPSKLAVSGNILFVLDQRGVGAYNATTGAVINGNLVQSLPQPRDLVVSGNTLFLASFSTMVDIGYIGEYNATTGVPINPALVALPVEIPTGLALVGNTLFVVGNSFFPGPGFNSSRVIEFDVTTGDRIKMFALQSDAQGIAVQAAPSVPEPATLSLIVIISVLFAAIAAWRNGRH